MNHNDQTFRCSECNREFPKELIDEFILNGKTAYCEYCGYPFRLTKDAKVQVSKDQPKSYSRRKKPRESKTKFSGPQFRLQFQQKPSHRRGRMSYGHDGSPAAKTSTDKRVRNSSHNNKQSYNISDEKKEGEPKPTPEKDLNELKDGIDGFLKFVKSPFILIIGIIITIGRLIALIFSFSLGNLSNIIINMVGIILLYILIHQLVISKLEKGDYSNIGIDAIAFGAAGLPLYGMGIFILIEGIMILVYEILTRRNEFIEAGEKKFNHLSAEMTARSIHVLTDVMFKVTVLILIIGLPILINLQNILNGAFWAYLVFLILSLFLLSYISNTFIPDIDRYSFDELEENFLIKTLIFSAICLGNGTGAVLLSVCILIFAHRELMADIKKSKDHEEEIMVQVPVIDVSEENSKSSGVPPIEVIKQQDENPSKNDTMKKENINILGKLPDAADDELKPQKADEENKKFDEIIKEKNIQQKKEKRKSGDTLPNKDKEEQIQLYLNRIFTVLSGEVRKRIMELDIPEKEKYEVLTEFVNLTEKERKKYLEELEDVNRKISQELVTKIVKMNLNYEDKQKLIDQLKLMTPSDQLEFIRFLTVEQPSE